MWKKVSGEDALHHMTMNVGETEVSSLVLEGQSLMIDAEEMKQGGVEVVYVDRVGLHAVAVVVGGTVGGARLDPSSGHPHGIAARMMISARSGWSGKSSRIR